MRAVVTRVSGASVSIGGKTVGAIGRGFLILLGVGPDDTTADATRLAEKILSLRVFTDENDKMNLDLQAVDGQVLVISQFTLYGSVKKGRRPSFTGAALPEDANKLYEFFLSECARLGYVPQHGSFGADMQVTSCNDGPVTLYIDSVQLLPNSVKG